MDIWTEEDERKLQSMQQRKKETQEKQSEKLIGVINRHVPIRSGRVSEVDIYDLRNAMIEHGGEFRDALLPFDHMGRPTPSVEVTALDDETRVVASAWIKHTPGPPPVVAETIVEVGFRDGTSQTGSAGAYSWYEWGDTTIVAYRVIG